MGERIYIGSCSGTFFALDRRDGRKRWSYDVRPEGRPTSFHGDAVVSESLIVIGTDGWTSENRLNHICAFDLTSGAVRWKAPVTDGIVSDIVRAGNRIVATTRTDSLLCLDLESGRRLWSFAADGRALEEGPLFRSPAVADGRVFVGDMEGRVHALDIDSGRLFWSRPISSAISTGILAIGDELVVADTRGVAHLLDQATGEVRDTIDVGDDLYGPPVSAPDSSVTFVGNQAISCLDLASARIRWTRDLSVSSTRPYLWRGDILVSTTKGELVALRLSDGQPRWSRTFTGMIRAIGHDDRTLFLGTQEGMLYAYERGDSADRATRWPIKVHPTYR